MDDRQEQLRSERKARRPQVALYVTCLADLFRPSVAFAALSLLEQAGCDVSVPKQQSCCGQPAYNTGDYDAAAPLAHQVIEAFADADYVVVPSGSCAGMIREHYPKLLKGEWRERALAVAAKTYELTTFLAQIAPLQPPHSRACEGQKVTYHDSCAGLRELGIKHQPRQLLQEICGTDVNELSQADVCCGFGGTFCAKMPALSGKMVQDKLDDALATGADILVGGDLGCLLNIAGRASRVGAAIEVRHIAELLADQMAQPPIGQGD
ncbi:MAG: (Fe-S)-binding protein [Pseudomonadota bacterium]